MHRWATYRLRLAELLEDAYGHVVVLEEVEGHRVPNPRGTLGGAQHQQLVTRVLMGRECYISGFICIRVKLLFELIFYV